MSKEIKKKLAFGMIKESKPTAGSGNFKKLQGGIADEYEAKGKSKDEAEKIGSAIAAKMGNSKYGKAAMAKAAAKGRK